MLPIVRHRREQNFGRNDGPENDTDVSHCGRGILSSELRRKKKKPSPKKDEKEAAGVPSAKRALGTWRV